MSHANQAATLARYTTLNMPKKYMWHIFGIYVTYMRRYSYINFKMERERERRQQVAAYLQAHFADGVKVIS